MSRLPLTEIVVISSPRSGTNFFIECIAALKKVDSYLELFNRRGVMGVGNRQTLAHFSDVIGQPVTHPKDPMLIDMFRTRPISALEELRDVARREGRQAICYKVFPNQLSDPDMEAILARPGVRVIFLTRRRLDVYISYLKARATDTWTGRKTSDISVEVMMPRFRNWARKQDAWYEHLRQAVTAAAIPFVHLTYDDDVDVGKEALIERIRGLVSQWGVDDAIDPAATRPRLQRQDLKVGPFKKIRNGESLREELRAAGLYNYSITAPMSKADADADD